MAQKKLLKPKLENKLVIDKYITFRESQKKAKNTIDSDRYILEKLGDHLAEKEFKDVSDEDLQCFFKEIDNFRNYNLFGMKLISFYRWLFRLKRKERPEIMEWFMQKTNNDLKRKRDP